MNSRRSHTSSSKSKRVQPQGIKKKLETKTKKQRVKVEINPWCEQRANEIASNLPPGSRFIKQMRPSQVVKGFWLGVPVDFCNENFPECFKFITLFLEVGENGENRHPVKYLNDSTGLSGGWRGFSMAHELKVGDFLVFQFLEPCTFKVHIVRVSEFQDDPKRPEEEEVKEMESEDDEYDKMTLTDLFKMKKRKLTDVTESLSHFKDVKCFDNFNIKVDGRVLGESVIPAQMQKRYYKLCESQEMSLHENLKKGLDCEILARVISGMVEIADGIWAAMDTSSFEAYSRSLELYESYGMEVGFLRARIDKLMDLTCEWGEYNKSEINELKVEVDVSTGVDAELGDVEMSMENLADEIHQIEEAASEALWGKE